MPPHKSLLYRYGHELNSHDVVKIVAGLLMIGDHLGLYLFDNNLWLRLLGRGAAPLFFFLIGFGGKLRFRMSLIIYAFILSAFTIYLKDALWINILFNFMLIQCLLWVVPLERLSTATRIVSFIVLFFLNFLISPYLEYGTLGILLGFSARLVARDDPQKSFWLGLSLLAYAFTESVYFKFYIGPYHFGAFLLLILGLYAVMREYQLKRVPCPKILLLPGLILSRYSLEVYFYHLIILESFYYIVKNAYF